MARNAAQRREYFKGFQVIRDTVEIDELLHSDDSITIEDCFGFVLIELPRGGAVPLDEEATLERARELADESMPYGISSVTWAHNYEGGGTFVRFTVSAWEAITQEQREEDAGIFKADEKRDSAREVTLG